VVLQRLLFQNIDLQVLQHNTGLALFSFIDDDINFVLAIPDTGLPIEEADIPIFRIFLVQSWYNHFFDVKTHGNQILQNNLKMQTTSVVCEFATHCLVCRFAYGYQRKLCNTAFDSDWSILLTFVICSSQIKSNPNEMTCLLSNQIYVVKSKQHMRLNHLDLLITH